MNLKFRLLRNLKEIHWLNFIPLTIAGTINAFGVMLFMYVGRLNAFESNHAAGAYAVDFPCAVQFPGIFVRAEEAGLCVHALLNLCGVRLLGGVGLFDRFFPA